MTILWPRHWINSTLLNNWTPQLSKPAVLCSRSDLLCHNKRKSEYPRQL